MFLYKNKFDFRAKSLVTNTVVINRVLCIFIPYFSACMEITHSLKFVGYFLAQTDKQWYNCYLELLEATVY